MSRFTEAMTQRLHDAEMSQSQLANAIHVNKSLISRILAGTRTPTDAIAKAIDTALGAGGELAALAAEPPPAPPPPRPGPLGQADADAARATTRHLVALDTLHGSDGLSPMAVRAFRTAADRLAVAGGTPDVRAAVADLGAAAAWITSDDVRRDESRAIALEALALADLAGDERLRLFLVSHLSMVNEHAGRYGDALAYAERGMAEPSTNPRVRAMFEVRRARALSGLGAIDEALAALDHAGELLQETPVGDDGLTYWIHDSELAIHRAVILTRGERRNAVDWGHRGVEWLPDAQGRDQVLFRAMLLHDAVVARAWQEVPNIAADLIAHAGAARTARVPEQLDIAWRLVNGPRVPAAARDAVAAARAAFTA